MACLWKTTIRLTFCPAYVLNVNVDVDVDGPIVLILFLIAHLQFFLKNNKNQASAWKCATYSEMNVSGSSLRVHGVRVCVPVASSETVDLNNFALYFGKRSRISL